jgi:hypothetical protein
MFYFQSGALREGRSQSLAVTLWDKSIFLDLSHFFVPPKALLILAISFKTGFTSAVRTFLFSKWILFGNIEP